MANFVDDDTPLPADRTNARTPTAATSEINAAVVNALNSACEGLRDRALKKDPDDATALTAFDASFNKLKLTASSPNSRDNPTTCLIFENTGLPNNPKFCIGNPYEAGIGLEAWGVWYTDDLLDEWKIVLSGERSGTFAAVLDGVRRSTVEGFIQNNDQKPWMRIEASSQALQVGPGGFEVLAGNAVRSGGVLTLEGETEHKMQVGDLLFKQGGDVANFGADGEDWGPGDTTMTVASVVNATTITVTDARADYVSTVPLYFSAEVDVLYGRGAPSTAEIRLTTSQTTTARFAAALHEFIFGGTAAVSLSTNGISLATGRTVINAGSNLDMGADSTLPLRLSANRVHVREGMEFYNQGRYRSTGWYNGGGQTQSTQEVFLVGTGAGAATTYVATGMPDWTRIYVANKGQGGSNDLTVASSASETFNGAASFTLPADSGATLVKEGTDWTIFYSPPPP